MYFTKRSKIIEIKGFEFENMKIDVIINHRKDHDYTTRELLENYMKLLEFRDQIKIGDIKHMQNIIEALYTTKKFDTFYEKCRHDMYCVYYKIFYNTLIADRKRGIITKKMIEKDL